MNDLQNISISFSRGSDNILTLMDDLQIISISSFIINDNNLISSLSYGDDKIYDLKNRKIFIRGSQMLNEKL